MPNDEVQVELSTFHSVEQRLKKKAEIKEEAQQALKKRDLSQEKGKRHPHHFFQLILTLALNLHLQKKLCSILSLW